MTPEFTHFDVAGQASMVDVTEKAITTRTAIATGMIVMQPSTLTRLQSGTLAKGDAFAVARLAGIMAAKKTADLIPLCHPLALTKIAVDLAPTKERADAVTITATCRLSGRTGVEMEALTAVSVAALTLYDMCKAVDKTMEITGIRLIEKTGGKTTSLDSKDPLASGTS
ncbi:cyclic pyranopterin monophosphate synthase [Azospirillaceae bacterium]